MELTTRSELLARLKKDEEDSWNEFVSLYAGFIKKVCIRQNLQDSDASDIVQQVCMEWFRACKGFEYDPKKGRFRDYLCQMVSNAITKLKKKKRVQPELDEDSLCEDDPLQKMIETEYRECMVKKAITIVKSEFEPITYQAFEWTEFNGMKIREVAQKLGIKTNTVSKYRSRVKERLQKIIGDLLEQHE
ncbi:MAG: sigma-70 family RNA polymerase sigma factor [Gemmataceae bacterium]|jgi:RNA polymerase sigma-70 factor (ECF subfamily)|nr:sigma-70 family RNA polymerase sigma factor [Gemmataceae bacterium]